MATVVLTGAGGLPMWPKTLVDSQEVPTGYMAVAYGTLTISGSVVLTVSGTLLITNY